MNHINALGSSIITKIWVEICCTWHCLLQIHIPTTFTRKGTKHHNSSLTLCGSSFLQLGQQKMAQKKVTHNVGSKLTFHALLGLSILGWCHDACIANKAIQWEIQLQELWDARFHWRQIIQLEIQKGRCARQSFLLLQLIQHLRGWMIWHQPKLHAQNILLGKSFKLVIELYDLWLLFDSPKMGNCVSWKNSWQHLQHIFLENQRKKIQDLLSFYYPPHPPPHQNNG